MELQHFLGARTGAGVGTGARLAWTCPPPRGSSHRPRHGTGGGLW